MHCSLQHARAAVLLCGSCPQIYIYLSFSVDQSGSTHIHTPDTETCMMNVCCHSFCNGVGVSVHMFVFVLLQFLLVINTVKQRHTYDLQHEL